MNISSMFKPKVNAADMPLEMVARNTNLSATDKVKAWNDWMQQAVSSV